MIGVACVLPGTLGTDDGLYRAALEYLLKDLSSERPVKLDGRVAARLLDELAPTLVRPHRADFNAIFDAFPGLALSPAAVEARFRMWAIRLVGAYFRPEDGAAATLAELAKLQIPRALFSDGWSAIEKRKASLLDFDWPVVVGEDFEKARRGTSLAAFAALASALRLPADRIWFVGSDPRHDIAQARAAGFRTVWYNRTGAPFPEGHSAPDHTIARLRELLPLLSEPYTEAALALRQILRTAAQWRPGHYLSKYD